MGAFLTASDVGFLLERLRAIPDSENCVHFDLHSSNIMIRKNEALIIDLGDFSIGSYFFDIGLLSFIYGLPELGICEMATKMPSEQGIQLYENFLDSYFVDRPAADFEFFRRNQYF